MGKAPEYKIFKRNLYDNRLQKALDDAGNVVIKYNGDIEGLGNIIRKIRCLENSIDITISMVECLEEFMEIKKQYIDCIVEKEYYPEKYDKHLVMCEHIFKIKKDMPRDVYIDSWCNIIFTQEDFEYAANFESMKKLFIMCKKELIMNTI